jgi:hypothetical protein
LRKWLGLNKRVCGGLTVGLFFPSFQVLENEWDFKAREVHNWH